MQWWIYERIQKLYANYKPVGLAIWASPMLIAQHLRRLSICSTNLTLAHGRVWFHIQWNCLGLNPNSFSSAAREIWQGRETQKRRVTQRNMVLQMYYKEFHALPSGSAIVTVGINLSPDCNYRLASGKKFQILFWDLTWENRTHTKCSWTYARFWSTNRWWCIQTWEWEYTMSTCANHIRLSSKKISFAQAVMISHVIASLASTLVQRVRESSARIKCEHDA